MKCIKEREKDEEFDMKIDLMFCLTLKRPVHDTNNHHHINEELTQIK